MNRIASIVVLTFFFALGLFSQHHPDLLTACDKILSLRGEVYIQFDGLSKADYVNVSKVVSIDHATNATTAFAYVNRKHFEAFLDWNISFDIVEDYYESREVTMLTLNDLLTRFSGDCLQSNWDFYPTYEAYVAMMNQFATDNPTLCSIHSLGTLSSGREILALKITNQENDDTDKPKFLYTSSMHGDETAGFPLLLRLSDYLLCQYDEKARVKELVDNIEIWINPLANPNGTYFGGNNTVTGAIRSNAKGIDLNRNYPDPELGMHPDGEPFQEETTIFMDFAEEHKFNMSANFHGGAEVFNYPFDTWERLPADDEWWKCLGRAYADTVHLHAPNGYFDLINNGVSNGFEWFQAQGTRQDFTTYFKSGREFTLELTDQKLLDSDELPLIWNYHHRSLLNFLEECNYGLRGLITDSENGDPLEAEVFILNHDVDNSEVFSTMPLGRYYRYLNPGIYEIRYATEDYKEQTISIEINKGARTIQNVELVPKSVSTNHLLGKDVSVWAYDSNVRITNNQNASLSFSLIDVSGKRIHTETILTNTYEHDFSNQFPTGIYFVVIESSIGNLTKKVYF